MRKIERLIRNVYFWAAVSCLYLFVVAVEAADVPPIPEGYATELSLKTAILFGQIKLIDAGNVSVPDQMCDSVATRQCIPVPVRSPMHCGFGEFRWGTSLFDGWLC
jgi:hypothetical protein